MDMTPTGGRMATYIRRREFIVTLGSAAAVWPLAARAQTPARLPLIAILVGGTPARATWLSGFQEGMNALGYAEGRNYDVVYRFASGRFDAYAGACGRTGSAQTEHYRNW